MNFEKAKKYLESFVSYENMVKIPYGDKQGGENGLPPGIRAFDLSRVRNFLREYGVDYGRLKYVHVAGSKGKGSTCYIIADYLSGAGYRVGLYTSPHMKEVTERFWLNGKDISEAKFAEYVADLKKFIESIPVALRPFLTYFEILTVIALKFFVDEGVDYAVLEVGLGGRLDATNIVRPVLSVITNVELEHVGILGNNLEEILHEKLGIVKEGVPVLIGQRVALKLIKKKLGDKKDVFYTQNFKMKFSGKSFSDVARFQNACTAFSALKILLEEVDEKRFLQVATGLNLPGRFDIRMIDGRTVVFDLAHTKNSIENLVRALGDNFPGKLFVFLVAIMKGKDVSGILKQIGKIAGKIVFTNANENRGIPAEELKKMAEELGLKCSIGVMENCRQAYGKLLKEAGGGWLDQSGYQGGVDRLRRGDRGGGSGSKIDVVLVVTGSHFLVGKLLDSRKRAFPKGAGTV